MNKRVLIVTYYWPPSGGSGVQRWLKFVKYLTQAGWEPYVFTPENPSFTIQDASLQKDIPASVEVIRFPIWEPYQLFFKMARLLGNKSPQQADFITIGRKSLLQKVSAWVRGNFFIPDARVFWVKPSVRYLIDFLERNKIDKIITTGPPHSIHLIGLKLKRLNPTLYWFADFRDPWSEWDLLDTLSLTWWARRRHKKLERTVLTLADEVITIAPYHVQRFEELSGRHVHLITNGFDEDDFSGIVHCKTEKFTVRHIGIVDELRDPKPFMVAVKTLCQEHGEIANKIVIEFIGKINSSFKYFVKADPVLAPITRFVDHLPHDQLLKLYGATDLQLLVLAHTVIAPGNLPGKFFEYLASGNPILAIGPVLGDAGRILKQSEAGSIREREDAHGIATDLFNYYSTWRNGEKVQSKGSALYSRKNLTNQLIHLLGEVKSN